jgi:hypothetical protein
MEASGFAGGESLSVFIETSQEYLSMGSISPDTSIHYHLLQTA